MSKENIHFFSKAYETIVKHVKNVWYFLNLYFLAIQIVSKLQTSNVYKPCQLGNLHIATTFLSVGLGG